jgi:hypothetical protein
MCSQSGSPLRQRRHRLRRLALSRNQRRLRDHGRRRRGDQGTGHRPVRQAIPRGRVQRARPRLPAAWRQRRAAAPGPVHLRSACRLASHDRVRPGPARRRPGQARDLGLLPLRRPRLPRRGAQPAAGGGVRADAKRRPPGSRAQRHPPPEAARDAAPGRQGHPRRRRQPGRPPAPAGAAGRPAGVPSRSSPRRTASTATGRSTPPTGTPTGSRRSPPAPRSGSSYTGPAATRPGWPARCLVASATRISQG